MLPDLPPANVRLTRSASHTDDDAAAIRWIGVLAKGWAVLAIGAVLGGFIGLVAATRTRPVFEATVVVGITPPPEDSELTTQGMRALFTDAAVASEVVRELNLNLPPHSLTAGSFLGQSLTVESIPNTYLTRLKVRLTDARMAATAAAGFADKLQQRMAAVWRESLRDRADRLQREVQAARAELIKAEQAWLAARLAAPATRLDIPRTSRALHDSAGSNETARRSLTDRLAESERRGNEASRQGPGRTAPGRSLVNERYTNEFALVRLENEVEVRRDVFMKLDERLERDRAALAATPQPLRVVQTAVVPDQPVRSTRSRTVALATIAGLILAGCFIVAREWRTRPVV